MGHRKQEGRKDMTYRQNISSFLSCVEELRERPFVLDGLYEVQFHISVDEQTGQLKCEFQEADQEYFRSFLLTFRKFILNGEPSNIDWVLNACRRFARGEEEGLREELDELKTVWGYRYRKGVVQMHSGGLNLTPEYVLDLWINGQYFHGDPRKGQRLEKLLAQALPSVKIQLRWSLPLLTDVILRVGSVVSQALEAGHSSFQRTCLDSKACSSNAERLVSAGQPASRLEAEGGARAVLSPSVGAVQDVRDFLAYVLRERLWLVLVENGNRLLLETIT